jgi:phenylalanyl-tRNA synthetase beta chain
VSDTLRRAGANEVLTYSFVHEKLLEKAGQDASHAYKLSNALSPDLQYYRLSLTPSLLDKVHMNVKAGYDAFSLFELNKVHFKGEMDAIESDVPNEDAHAALVMAYGDKRTPKGAPYFYARRYLETIVDMTLHELTPLSEFDVSADEWGKQLTAAFDPARSAVILKDNQVWGVVGEYMQAVKRAFKLPAFAAGFEVHSDLLSAAEPAYRPLSRFPSVTQDVSIRVNSDTTYQQVETIDSEVIAGVGSLEVMVEPIIVYRPEDGNETTTTFRLNVTSYETTLTDGDVKPIVDAIETQVKNKLSGRVV